MEKKSLYGFMSFIIFFFSSLLVPGRAGDFKVTPIRLDFDKESQISVVTVEAEGPRKLNFQIRAYEWIQDGEGRDRYRETDDLIFFPKLMTVTKEKEKNIRVGVKNPVTEEEKTYRLFIEEIPEKAKHDGLNISIALRFGVPIFVKPVKEDVRADIERLHFADGTFTTFIKNTGNTHIPLTSVVFRGTDSKGAELFSNSVDGWYLLRDSLRPYSVKVAKGVCQELSKVSVEVVSDRLSLTKDFEVKHGTCSPQPL